MLVDIQARVTALRNQGKALKDVLAANLTAPYDKATQGDTPESKARFISEVYDEVTFEGYGPVGERRTRDLAGRPVDAHAVFPGADEGTGLEGLQTYIHAHREKDFLNNLSEKMLVYALGRAPLLSDEPLLEEMRTKLSGGGYRISSLIETIVTSPQFLNRRNPETIAQKGD